MQPAAPEALGQGGQPGSDGAGAVDDLMGEGISPVNREAKDGSSSWWGSWLGKQDAVFGQRVGVR